LKIQEKDSSQTTQANKIEVDFQIQGKEYESTTQTSGAENVYNVQEKDYDRTTQSQEVFQSQEKDYNKTTQTNVTTEDFKEISELQTATTVQNIDDMKQVDSNLPDSNLEQSTPVTSPIFEHLQAPPGLETVSQFNQYNGLNSSQLPVGDILKSKFIEFRIIPTCL
ncbi:21286_t:CDS:1, partial [Racocetra persica]